MSSPKCRICSLSNNCLKMSILLPQNQNRIASKPASLNPAANYCTLMRQSVFLLEQIRQFLPSHHKISYPLLCLLHHPFTQPHGYRSFPLTIATRLSSNMPARLDSPENPAVAAHNAPAFQLSCPVTRPEPSPQSPPPASQPRWHTPVSLLPASPPAAPLPPSPPNAVPPEKPRIPSIAKRSADPARSHRSAGLFFPAAAASQKHPHE